MMLEQENKARRGVGRVMRVIAAFIGLTMLVVLGLVLVFGKTVQRRFQVAKNVVDTHVTTGPIYRDDVPSSRPAPSFELGRVPSAPIVFTRAQAAAMQERVQGPQSSGIARHHKPEGFTLTAEDPRSTFAADVDTGAYTRIRATLNQGLWPYPAEVRPEEVVNYFGYSDPAPSEGALAVSLEAAPSLFYAQPERYMLRVGVRGKRVAPKDRKPAHLVFLVDVSGSMGHPDKLPLAKQALGMMVRQLRVDDTVALVTYASGSRVVLKATSAKHRDRIIEALDALNPEGGTHMSNGMQLAYEVAASTYVPDHINRVIVLSDGDVNIGATSHTEILSFVRAKVDEGVTLSTIGVGMTGYQDHMMERLADTGNGSYYFIDNPAQARRVFVDQLTSTLQVIAKDVKLQVEFNPKAVKQYRLIGYENRAIKDEDFRDDKVDAGEIGAGHTVTAMYEVILNVGHEETRLGEVRVRYKEPEGHVASERAFEWSARSLRTSTRDSSRDFQLAAAAVAFAQKLRCAPGADELSWSLLREIARGARDPDYPEREELELLIKQAMGMPAQCR